MTLTHFKCKSQYRHEGQVKLQVEVGFMSLKICITKGQRIERRNFKRVNTAHIYGYVSLL